MSEKIDAIGEKSKREKNSPTSEWGQKLSEEKKTTWRNYNEIPFFLISRATLDLNSLGKILCVVVAFFGAIFSSCD